MNIHLIGKPVIVLGHGVRAAEVDPVPLLNLSVPVLTSWQGMDLVDNWHPAYFGRPGIYGQRCANKILYEADHILAIGARMCVWMIGHAGLRPEQKVSMVDIDVREVEKIPGANQYIMGVDEFLRHWEPNIACYDWWGQCQEWKAQMPWIESPTHDDTNGYINSYRFIERLQPLLRADEVITTDNGSVMCPIFQALRVKPPQRVMTAGALGEMGCGLPGAVGASFARGKGEVLAFIGDGGMMMNLQELATIAYHKLPIKMMVLENDGYSMIKGTYDNVKKPRQGVSKETGLEFPHFARVARAFGIDATTLREWRDFDEMVGEMLAAKGPFLLQVNIDPEQIFLPRLKPIIKDGKITPARFDQLSPL